MNSLIGALALAVIAGFAFLVIRQIMAGSSAGALGEVSGRHVGPLFLPVPCKVLVLRPDLRLAKHVRLQYRGAGSVVAVRLDPFEARAFAALLREASRRSRGETPAGPPGARRGPGAR